VVPIIRGLEKMVKSREIERFIGGWVVKKVALVDIGVD
jgi:hypothetical protein